MLKKGDVIELKVGMKVYYNNRLMAVTDTYMPPYLLGKYVVTHTTYDGGSTGGGMNGHDDYPNGHHVFCLKIDGVGGPHDVDFYQSGCFTAVNEKVPVIGHAIQRWEMGE